MKDKDTQLIWEAAQRLPGRERPEFQFTSRQPLTSNYMYLQSGDIGIEIEDMTGRYYQVEAEIGWYGQHYKSRYSGTTAAEEPDEEPEVDGVNVVYVRDEDDKEVDEATFKAIDTWVSDQLNHLGWSDMKAMGWEPPTDDGDY